MRRALLLAATFVAAAISASATTLPPEFKAYDFARAYYIEDGGVVIVPQDGFHIAHAIATPEGIRVMPGQRFTQYDPARHIEEDYTFTRLAADEHRAYFHERRYRYERVPSGPEKNRMVRQAYLDSDDFYLSHWRGLEWFDFAFPYLDIHPGERLWRTRE
jgi:hypothetical protein